MAYLTKFMPPTLVNNARLVTVCFHPSLLPEHRGPSAISWAIRSGKQRTGISIFWPNEGLDEGDILLQKEALIGDDDTLGDLYSKKLFPLGVDAMVEAVDLAAKGELVRLPQDLNAPTSSYESWFRNEAVALDFTKPVTDVYNIIRAANPSPGATASYQGCSLKIFDSKKMEGESDDEELGKIVEIDNEGVHIQARHGRILVKRVEVDGKRLAAAKWAKEAGVQQGSKFDAVE